MRRKKRTPFGNHPVIVVCWWLFNLFWFLGCTVATVFLARLLAGMLWFTILQGPPG